MADRTYLKNLEEPCTLPDGRVLCLRPIRPEDEPEHYDLLDHVDPQDRQFRFFAAVSTISQETMERFTRIDYEREMAFIASAETDDSGHETLGVVRIVADDENKEAEFAIVIRTDLKHHGIGHFLMDKAIRYCRERGYVRLTGLVLPNNQAMRDFARSLGFTSHLNMDDKVVEISFDLAD
ncbi:MAG: GNAT family N-acetyltransferase [Rhodospirillales bacterium]|nr:GNAT family N-acetyltransferase [Rhodospirillales bacterium]